MRHVAGVATLALLLFAAPARSGDAADDPVASTWKQRAALAEKRLGGDKLDACDRGLEEAFRSARVLSSDDGTRRYHLAIQVDGKVLHVFYVYQGKRLGDFYVAALPAGWFAHQLADSKTLSVVLSEGSKCALDLCTSGPTADGPCGP